MKKQYALEINGLKKIYPNGFQAIFDINLKIEKGSFVVFVGPSGCGKSTILRMIAGLEKSTSGTLFLNGRNATELPARKRNLAIVFQNYALFPHLTVKENISFALKVKKLPKEVIEKKVLWAAETLKLKYLLNRKPMQLSGGQRQRVALGRAIVVEPELFLMDEPLSNLDAKLRGVMKTTIRKLHDSLNTTSIYVTHDQIEAMTMADKIIVMSDGFIQQNGTPEEVFGKPANKFVASFVGTPSINFIDGEIQGNKFVSKECSVDLSKTKFVDKIPKKVTLGIRPQYLKKTIKTGINTISSNVDFLEIHGAETIVYLTNGMKYICLTEKRPIKNSKINILFDLKKIIIFEGTKNGKALNYEINEETKSSLNTLNDSIELVKRRSNILEKQKNKTLNSTLLQKIIKYMNDYLYPEHIILNPILFKLKENKRNILENIKDAKRRIKPNEVFELTNKLKDTKLEIREKIKELKELSKDIRIFSKNWDKIENILKIYKNTKIDFNNIKKINKIHIEMKKVKYNFDKNHMYDKNKLDDINQKSIKLVKAKQ